MNTVWKNKASRAWLIVAPILAAILIIVNVLASVTYFDAIATLWGRNTMKITGNELDLYKTDEGINDKASALANGNRLSVELCEEGFVLLKNKAYADGKSALPLSPTETKISVFGKNSVDPAVGGSGSGGGVKVEIDIFDSLTAAGFTYNRALVDFYKDDSLSGNGRSDNPTDLDSGNAVTLDVGETPVANYSESLWNSCTEYSDAALIVFTRIGGEGFDMPRNSDGTHSLQLSKDENDLINKVTSLGVFGKVIIIINAVTTMELKAVNDNDAIDAVLWIGYTGAQGMTALGEILKGEKSNGEKLSPSGRTVDTWAADFTRSPVWENFGSALGGDNYKMLVGRGVSNEPVYFVDYEEGIYVGYRYYETAYAESEENGGDYDFVYSDEVVYPFGYGLSYTTFDWTLKNANEVEGFEWTENNSLTFEIEVTNTGEYPGRDVVELYVTAPYLGGTNADGIYGIEKSAKTLVGYAKTGVLEHGDSETVYIEIERLYDLASYDYNDANGNGKCCYEAEKGDYIFTVSTDAHNAKRDKLGKEMIITTELADVVSFETDPITKTPVGNLYTGVEHSSDAELGSVLSRADFAGTWPARRTDSEKTVTSEWISEIKNYDPDPNSPEVTESLPATGKNNGVKLAELIGLDYGNPLWNEFMDQLTVKELSALVNDGAFHTTAIERLQIPQTTSSDGPVGFTNFIGAPEIYDTCSYPCEVIVSSTWNKALAYEMGVAVGNEALIGNEKGDGAPYSGWYAPGLNIHRSPFGGRNYEYYSEDGYLSGTMTAEIVKGCAEKGVFVTMKHFALNDQETHRSINGLLTWATEQSMREIYLKAFEIAVKSVNAYAEQNERVIPLAVMSSFNRIGDRWAGGDYRLLTAILRDEWGFRGLVISDFNTCSHMTVKDMVYAGGDLNLQMAGTRVYNPDKTDTADMKAFRTAAKNILYVVANGNAMRGDFKIVPPLWQQLMFVFDAILIAAIAAWGVAVILRAFRKGKQSNS